MSEAPAPQAGTGEARDRLLRTTIALAVAAAAIRLIPLQFLQPLQWDEVEFFRATRWIAEGRVPYRDFWEHHTPLAWFLFAPVASLVNSPGVGAVIAMRWAQVPVWIATFVLLARWMRDEGIGPIARWSAIGIALASSFFMIAAVEYRVDPAGCLLVVAGLVLAQRRRYFWSGAVFCLAGFANLRLGPLLVIAVLMIVLVTRGRARAIVAGGVATLAAALSYFVLTGSLAAMWEQVWVENRLGDQYATRIPAGFAHRVLSPFGVRLLASDRLFDPSGIDVGGIALLVLGSAGVVMVMRRWRESSGLVIIVAAQVVNVLFIASMKFVYNYHFETVVVMMVPLVAVAIQSLKARRAAVALLALALVTASYASLLRGKEIDRAYQDLVMREVHRRTQPDETVWSGVAWATRREPAYRLWFLPDLARQLVARGKAEPYTVNRPPAAVVLDRNAIVWLTQTQPGLIPYFTGHYMPAWRELLVPAMNASLPPRGGAVWSVPRDGTYRLIASSRLAPHPWFSDPIRVVAYKGSGVAGLTVKLPQPRVDERIGWTVDGSAVTGTQVGLRMGQRLAVVSTAAEPMAVIAIAGADTMLFRQPPPGVSIDAERPRVTHWPDFRARIAP